MFRILIAIGQTPFDPTSGAAQATLHLAELLAKNGCEVRSLSTSGTEGVIQSALPQGKFTTNGVHHHIIRVAPEMKHSWHHIVGCRYDRCFDELIAEFRPDILFTFGDEAPDHSRRERAMAAGTKIVFCLHNEHYLRNRPENVSAFLCPSRYLANRYQESWEGTTNIKILPTPISAERVLSEKTEPVFTTFINPQPAKGLWFMVRFAEQLGIHHPEIPLRIIEGRATAADFINAANSAGIDLGVYGNLFFSHAVADVREIWATTRILLAPAVWNEPAGRTPVEAMLNGAVPIVSNRGGLAEQVGAAGFVLPLPENLTPVSGYLPSAEEIKPWIDAVVQLCGDEDHFTQASALAKQESLRFLPKHLAEPYLDFIREIMA